MIRATSEQAVLFERSAARAGDGEHEWVLTGLDAVLAELQATLERMALTRADLAFVQRIDRDQGPDALFRACTALIVSKLSGEIT